MKSRRLLFWGDSRRDFTYLYEPCRLRAPGQRLSHEGRLHGAACARLALDALSCRLSLGSFQPLRRLKLPSALPDDTAPSASLDQLEARPASVSPGAKPEPLERSP